MLSNKPLWELSGQDLIIRLLISIPLLIISFILARSVFSTIWVIIFYVVSISFMVIYILLNPEEFKDNKIKSKKQKPNLGNLSIIFACLSLIILPPIFGLVGIILGIIGVTKEEGATAIVGLVLSFIFSIIGMILWAWVWTNLL